jgi:hypothetical protein
VIAALLLFTGGSVIGVGVSLTCAYIEDILRRK